MLCFILLVITGAQMADAEEITIAAASDLQFAFKELLPQYEKVSGQRVKVSFGSSGNFYAQIQQGAPFDLYFSADSSYPKKLEEAGFAVPGSLYQYAVGRIVLWARQTSRLDLTQGFDILRQPAVKTIAVANPKHAPYGRAAVAAMKHFMIYNDVVNRLVLGENVSQTAQFVESGAADIGILALSLALAPTMQAKGTYWEIPAQSHPPLEQAAVIVMSSKQKELAQQFLEFVMSPQGQTIMTRYGFTVPEPR